MEERKLVDHEWRAESLLHRLFVLYCIGQGFALHEMTLLLAQIARRYRPTVAPGYQAELLPLISLQMCGGLPMYLRAR